MKLDSNIESVSEILEIDCMERKSCSEYLRKHGFSLANRAIFQHVCIGKFTDVFSFLYGFWCVTRLYLKILFFSLTLLQGKQNFEFFPKNIQIKKKNSFEISSNLIVQKIIYWCGWYLRGRKFNPYPITTLHELRSFKHWMNNNIRREIRKVVAGGGSF